MILNDNLKILNWRYLDSIRKKNVYYNLDEDANIYKYSMINDKRRIKIIFRKLFINSILKNKKNY